MTSIDDMTAEIMKGLTEYADLADAEMKKAVRKTAATVKNEISANAPVKSGRYKKSWVTKKTKENSHSLEMTVHSKNRYQIAHLLEHGHAKRGGGRVAAIPHIAPAEQHGEDMLETLIKKELS
ncbi:HK97 gp10 family phage protein [Ruminococcus champanellensis]|uniref:HK97 gp10 family phage protein n=1 Tax=Ruminococcus champanellensis TaxID=1161942 RepID=UPI002E78C954|nr:HK97 gp10 family phage protein [Ruminococcus champanellensis]MED9891313.1 HK97 gp10 family phage protein [Ruminococcus champanellensis]